MFSEKERREIIRLISIHQEAHPARTINDLKVARLHSAEEILLDGKVSYLKPLKYFNGTGEPPLVNSWVAVDDHKPGYWVDPFGHCRLFGQVRDGLINETMTVLPPGAWPEEKEHLRGQSSFTHARIDVDVDGTIVIMPPSSNVNVVLDGCHFKIKEGR